MAQQKIHDGLMKRKEMESHKRQIDAAISQKYAEMERSRASGQFVQEIKNKVA